MKTTTLSIIITLALSGGNVLVYAHQGGLVSNPQTNKNPSNKLNPLQNTNNTSKNVTINNSTKNNSSELSAANKTNTDSSDSSLNSITDNSNPDQPCKVPRRSNRKLIKVGINPDDIQNFSSLQLAQLTTEQIGAFDANNFANLLLEALSGLTSNLLSHVNKPALTGLNATQVTKIPPQSFQGFTHNNLGGLTPEAIQAITPEQLNEIVPTEFQAMSEKDISKLLANLNPEQDIGKVQSCLPSGWEIKPNKGLNRPVGAPITLRPFHHHNHQLMPSLDMAEVPDLSVGFGLGGSIDENGDVLTGINETIAATPFTAEQTEEGIIKVQDGNGTELAFLPDSDNLIQGFGNTEPTIETNEEGQYLLTLEGGQQIIVNPTLKDPQKLLENLPPQSTIQVNKQGHTRFYLAGGQRTMMCAFNPWVNKAPAGSKPGIKVTGQPGVNEQMVVVYEDGHAQEAYPAIQSPETFKNFALAFSGVDKVSLLANGKINVHYHGKHLTLTPAFDIKPAQTEPCSCSCSEEETVVEPNVEFNEDGSLTFTSETGDKQQIFVTEKDDDSEAVTATNNSDTNTLPEADDSKEVTKANNSNNALPEANDSKEVTEANNSNNALPETGDSKEVTEANNSDNTLPPEDNSSSAAKPSTTTITAADLTNTTVTDNTTTTSSNHSDNTSSAEDNSSETDNSSSEVKPSTITTTATNLPDITTTTIESNSHSNNTSSETNNFNSEVKPSTIVTTTNNPPSTTTTDTTTASNNSNNVLPPEENDLNSEVNPDITEITETNPLNTNKPVDQPEESNPNKAVDETEEPNETDTTTESNNSDNLPEGDNFNSEINPDMMEITETNPFNQPF